MSYKVTITWSPTTAQSAIEQLAETIGGRFDLEKSYVQTEMFKDTPYYSEAPDGTLGTGSSEADENTMHKGVLLAFKQAIENDEHSIVLTGIKRLTALYFEELSYVMGEQGFIIAVEEEPGGDHPVEVDEISFDILDYYSDYGEENVDWFVFENEGDTFYIVRVSKDYLPTEISYPINTVAGDYSRITNMETNVDSENNAVVYNLGGGLDQVLVIGATSAEGGTYGGILPFPTGGTWTLFNILQAVKSEYNASSMTISKVKTTLEEISVKTAPTKSGYFVGETLDLSGLRVEATYSYVADGVEKIVTKEISTDDCVISPQSGYVFSSGGVVDVSIAYEGKTTVCQVGAVEVDTGLSFTWDGVPDEFILSTEEPEDWETAWPMYYELDGQGGYKLAEPSTWTHGQYPEWKSDTYYLPKCCTATQYHTSAQQGSHDYAERYCLVLDGIVPDPEKQDAVMTYSASGVSSDYNAYQYASYNGSGFSYTTNGGGIVVCVKAPGVPVSVSEYITYVFDKVGTYFVQKRYSNTGVIDYPQELKFTV